jgi:F-type H+-transporting ATPase subunit delta
MPKISNIQYAQALYEAAKGKSQSEIDAVVAEFVKVLAKNNQVKNMQNIISKFREIWNQKEGIVEAEVASREKLDRDLIVEIEKFVKNKYDGDTVEIIEIIDKGIKGGIIIRVGDEVMDGSISRSLRELKNKLAQ